MAYDFLGLTNDVNRRLNEVELTSSTFATATGAYSAIKDSINSYIRYCNQHEQQWPFNHVEQEATLTAGEVRYAYPTDAKTIDFNSFRIKRNNTLGNDTKKLTLIAYEEYLNKFLDYEYNTSDTGIRGVPTNVFRAPNQEYGIVPPPNKAYEIVYEYYRLPVDLVNATDVPALPEQFRHVLVDGAMYYAYLFRGNTQDAQILQGKFQEGIKNMRSLYINRYNYLRSTMLSQNETYTPVLRVN